MRMRHRPVISSLRGNKRTLLVRGGLLLGILLFGLRAGLQSLAFMTPPGNIVGWSHLPSVTCSLCKPNVPGQSHALTPQEYAAILVKRLSLSDLLGQLLMVQFDGTSASPDTIQMIANQGAGGIIYYGPNIQSAAQVRDLNAEFQQLAPIPLILAVDQEGGTVNRLLPIVGPLPAAASLTSPAQARQAGEQDAQNLSMLGFNLNLAPVVDVGTANPQLYLRTFGSDPTQVASMAGAYLDGLQQSGQVTGTIKHFPGLGDTTTDPHIGLPVLHRSLADWESIDLAPYRTLIAQQQVRAVLVTHELVPAVDPTRPASLSPPLITGVLRQQLGFKGVVITDSLFMGALLGHWSMTESAVLAIKAGADLLIGPYNAQTTQDMKDALSQALTQGILTRSQIDQAVTRDLTLKLEMKLIPMPKSAPSRSQTPTVPPSVQPTALDQRPSYRYAA
jgi:beta-N-acetylhexosaminidase